LGQLDASIVALLVVFAVVAIATSFAHSHQPRPA
jgi:hypothetical protein